MTDRTNLRFAAYRLRDAMNHATKVTTGEKTLALIAAIGKAHEALTEAIDPLLVKCGDKEPLDDIEEIVYDKLQQVIKFDDKLWANVTPEQRFSLARVIVRQGGPDKIQHPVSGGTQPGDYIGVTFPHIFIGVESDGYAHS